MDKRQAHWEKVYQTRKNDEVGWYQPYPEQSIDLIDSVATDKGDAIIDVGGGASLLIDTLIEKGYSRLSLLDISDAALQCVQQRLGEDAHNVEWFTSDITSFSPPHCFSLWHDRAVLHFLIDSADREKYLQVLKNALEPNAHVILATFAEDGPEMCSGLPVERYDREKMQHLLGEQFQLIEQRKEIHTTPSGVEQKFNFFLFKYLPD